MAGITESFGGESISKPGAYSESNTDVNAGAPIGANDTLLILGESDSGPAGTVDGIQSFSGSAFGQLKALYRTGPIVDAAIAAFGPSKTPNIGGAGRILVYQTNATIQAFLALANAYGTITATEYGVGGNRQTYKNLLSAEAEISVTGSAPITDFGGLDALTLEFRQNGGTSEVVTFSTPANIGDVITQIDAQTTGLTASDSTGAIKITMDVVANPHQLGYGRSLEVVGGTALALTFLTASLNTPATEPQASITLTQPRDNKTESATIGGVLALEIGRDFSTSATAATVTVTDTQIDLTATGSTSYVLTFEDNPLIGNIVDAINALAGWTATATAKNRNRVATDLDEVVTVGAYSATEKPARLKIDAADIAAFYTDAALVSIASQSETGLPDAEGPTNLAGGVRGASSSSSFDAGFSEALAEECNVILPLIAQDASDDILLGHTDPTSTYDVETVMSQLDTHLRLRSNIKNRKEAQGMMGYRKQAKADIFEQTALTNAYLIQVFFLDSKMVDATNTQAWKQPYIEAALAAGTRLGTAVGEPLTHKFLNTLGMGHYVNFSTGKVTGDFNALIDYEEAISAGATFSEPASGGFRFVIDNTTYQIDPSFVFNRGSVVEASQFIAVDVRTDAELAFVGKKNAVIDAATIKARIRARLTELNKPDVAITTSSDDAPLGFRDDGTFVVTVTGNKATVTVEAKPVQGLDFILITFTLGETTQTA